MGTGQEMPISSFKPGILLIGELIPLVALEGGFNAFFYKGG
jgi:hypothetical protein